LKAEHGQQSASVEDSADVAELELRVYGHRTIALRMLEAAARDLKRAGPQIGPWVPGANPLGLRLASLFAMAGRADRARALAADYDRQTTDSVRRRLDDAARNEALGWISLADRQPLNAVAAFHKSDSLSDGPADACPICVDPRLGLAFDRADMTDSAMAALEHYVNTPYAYRWQPDALNLAFSLRRLGELYEARGNNAKAAKNYRTFVDLWRNADPELQPQVAEIRRRLRRLTTGKE
jgi:tetratricopeptide (TPR) repeat protein